MNIILHINISNLHQSLQQQITKWNNLLETAYLDTISISALTLKKQQQTTNEWLHF